jgi:hypothetical protein
MNPFDIIKSRNPSDMIKSMAGYKDKLAGIGEAVKQGFTHTNPAMTNFPSDTAEDLGSPDSAIKETK